MSRQSYCFIAMPFRPELNYFFLYLQKYLEDNYKLRVERGDARVLTKPLMEKIQEQILQADLVIGDVTGCNPNVFYELGLAHAGDKPILFLTQDDPANIPVDIRQFEFIQYDLANHQALLSKLDNAILNVFGEKYKDLYQTACILLKKFNVETGCSCKPKAMEEFQPLLMQIEQNSGIPSGENDDDLAEFLLPKIIEDFSDSALVKKYTEWTTSKSAVTYDGLDWEEFPP